MRKLSYHIYRLLLSEIVFLNFIGEDLQKLSRHFIGALKQLESGEKVIPRYMIIEITCTIQVPHLFLLQDNLESIKYSFLCAAYIHVG